MATTIEPIRPEDVDRPVIQPGVIDAFNELIRENWDSGVAVIPLRDVHARVRAKLGVPAGNGIDRRWLNVEDAFRAVGWDVEYESPGWDESYMAHYTFRKG